MKWEYSALVLAEGIDMQVLGDKLDKKGEDGWELIPLQIPATQELEDQAKQPIKLLMFKRPLE